MKQTGRWLGSALAAVFLLAALPAAAQYPAPREGDWVAHDFKFHDGTTMAELRLHYATVGNPSGEPVLVLHGTAGSGGTMLTPTFAGALFGAGQALDAGKYFLVLPDALGAGKSAKPSDGLRAKFPHYDYDDMVQAQYRLLTEGLGVRHLRLVIGNSMGGMQTWVWGEKYPDFMDALAPMASQPTEMSARNWMMRRMLIETIRSDPAYDKGDYTVQPPSMRLAIVMFGIATSGGTLAYQAMAPTRALADKQVDERLAAPLTADANDFIWQWDSSRDYNAAPGLGRITAALLAINSADDERNPPETGNLERALKQVKNGRLLLIPASADTRGHGTTAMAKFWSRQLEDFLRPHRSGGRSMTLLDHVQEMARNNAWSNGRLLAACATLTDAEFGATRVSFFPSLRQTLNHILIVDWYYIDALTEGGRGRATYANEVPFPVFADLAAAQRASDRQLVAFCDGLDEAGLARAVTLDRGERGLKYDPVAAVLAHLFIHQIHHRGQAHAMLSGTPVEPPQLDEFFLKEDAQRSVPELAALGIARTIGGN